MERAERPARAEPAPAAAGWRIRRQRPEAAPAATHAAADTVERRRRVAAVAEALQIQRRAWVARPPCPIGGAGGGGTTGGGGGVAGAGIRGTWRCWRQRRQRIWWAAAAAGGSGGSTGGGGTGGTTSPCQAVLALDRSCTTPADCFAGAQRTNCCGHRQFVGFRNSVKTPFQTLEAQCDATYPACGCRRYSLPPTTARLSDSTMKRA